jgi:hypothetical protein
MHETGRKQSMKVNTTLGAIIFVAAVVSVPTRSIAAPEFLAYEGKNAIHEGQGGDKKTVDGIEFWSEGDPPHKFRVIGSLTDRRHETGLIGMVRMSSLDSDIAKAAKAAGGDAVILQSEDDDVIGETGFANTNVNGYGNYGGFHGNASTTGFSRQVRKHDSRYIVVKYLPDDAPDAAAPAKQSDLGPPH